MNGLSVFTCGVLKRERADGLGRIDCSELDEFLLNGEVDDRALSDRAGCRFNGDGRRSGRGGWDEDIACTGTARDKADGEDEGSEQTEESDRALLAG